MKNIFSFSKGVNWIYPFVVIVLLSISCKKEDKVGLNVQPDSGLIGFETIDPDSLTLEIKQIKSDSILTSLNSNASTALLGSYIDPEFGMSKASFVTQLRLSSNNQEFGNVTVDSAILSFRLAGAYGKAGIDTFKLTAQTMRVYELQEDLEVDSNYYSNRAVNHSASAIGEVVDVQPNFGDSVDAPDGKEPAQFQIKMDNTWAQNLMNAGDAVFADNNSFQNYLKGLVIIPENNHATGEGEILYVNGGSIYTRLTVYYHTDSEDDLNFEFLINDSCARFSIFEHDYTGTNVETALNNSTTSPDQIYLQTMEGVWAEIELTNFFNKFENIDAIINLAELRISTNDLENDYPAIPRLNLIRYDEEKAKFALPDATSYLDGTYDHDKDEYVFKISRYLEQLLTDYKSGQNNNFGLVLLPTNNGISANRTIIYGPGHAGSNKLKLKIYYTPIN